MGSVLFVSLMAGCSNETVIKSTAPDRYQGQPIEFEAVKEGDRYLITDKAGTTWDVTHAQSYGLDPNRYQNGLGPNTIRPLMLPIMWAPGESGYPDLSNETMVLGVELNGFVRAYPTWAFMERFEVANEIFGEAHVSVAF